VGLKVGVSRDVVRLGESVGYAVRVVVGTSVGLDVATLVDPINFEGANEPLPTLDGPTETRKGPCDGRSIVTEDGTRVGVEDKKKEGAMVGTKLLVSEGERVGKEVKATKLSKEGP
jgi:hypothetical protein